MDKTAEPLTGRKIVFRLHSLSLEEIYPDKNLLDIAKEQETFLLYGSYPAVVNATATQEKEETIRELSGSYLYKDILEFQAVRNPAVLTSLLKALALQIGSEVSYNELAGIVGIDKKTVERYIDLLEKNFIVFRLPPFFKNQRRAISKLRKIYFCDLGVRNAVINNFNFLENRSDVGALWENFCIVERIKRQEYHASHTNSYFLRTYDGAEIDLVEEAGGTVSGYEFKWSKRSASAQAKQLAGIDYRIITPENISGFII